MDNELKSILLEHMGEDVFVKYYNGKIEDIRYSQGIIGENINDTHFEIIDKDVVMNIPMSTVLLLAKDKLWWKEYNPENVYYGNIEDIKEEFENITGFPFTPMNR